MGSLYHLLPNCGAARTSDIHFFGLNYVFENRRCFILNNCFFCLFFVVVVFLFCLNCCNKIEV